MSTSVASRKAISKPTYKQLLIEAKKLRGQAGVKAFKRGHLLISIFEDREFRHDLGNVDDFKAAEILDEYVDDLCLTFFQLREMIAEYPKQSQWSDGRLRQMYEEMLEKRSQPEPAPKKSRKTATVAEVEALKDENKRLKTRIAAAQKRIEQLEQENLSLRSKLNKAA